MVKSSTRTRLAYLVMFLLASTAAWVLSNWATVILPFEPRLKYLPVHVGGASAVTRVMLGTSAFFSLMTVLYLGVRTKKDPRAFMEDGFWMVKGALLVGLIVGAFFIPNMALPALGWVSFGGASLFILFQVLLLIAFARQWNESWFAKWDEDNVNGWYYLHAGATLLLYGFTIAVTIAMYVMSTRVCGINSLFITVNFFAALAGFFASLSPLVRERQPSSGALQAGVIAAYATYLVWSAINSEGNACAVNSNAPAVPASSSAAHMTQLIVGVAFTIASVSYSALSMSMQSDQLATSLAHDDELAGLLNERSSADEETAAGAGGADAADEDAKKKPAQTKQTSKGAKKAGRSASSSSESVMDDKAKPLPYSFPFFHLTFALASLYMLNVLNNWMVLANVAGAPGSPADAQLQVNSGIAATWVKMCSSWAAHAIYLWSLFAPAVFVDREFE